MWIVEYKSPFSGEIVSKKFRAKIRSSAESAAKNYARETFFNFHQSIEINGYEKWHGVVTGDKFTVKKKYSNYD